MTPPETPSESDHRALALSACRAGDLPALQTHLAVVNQPPVLPPAQPPPYDHFPGKLVYHAITSHHPHILTYLFSIYPKTHFGWPGDSNLRAALEVPHLPTFKVVYARTPSILDADAGEGGASTLGRACSVADPAIPNFLLDEGADPDGALGFQPFRPLPMAIASGQPAWLVQKLIRCGARFWLWEVEYAMRMRGGEVGLAEGLYEMCDFGKVAGGRGEWLRGKGMECAMAGGEEMVGAVVRWAVEESEREENGGERLVKVQWIWKCKKCGRRICRKRGRWWKSCS